MLTIGLLTGSVTSANYGVNALSISNVLFLERVCQRLGLDHQYILFGDSSAGVNQGDIFRKVKGLEDIKMKVVPELEFRKLGSIKTFIQNMKGCDIVFDTSGGDSYSDIYGSLRILHQSVPKIITLSLGKALIFTPQTLGPFKNKFWKWICGRILVKSKAVFARDHTSFTFAKENFRLKNLYEVTDMAMILPYEKKDEKSQKLRIGVNVSGLLYSGGYTENNQFGLKDNYKELIDKLIGGLVQRPELEVHLVPHVVTTGVESDNEVCEKIKKKFPEVIYEGAKPGAMEAKSLIATMDVFMGSRMHATIGALSSGIAVLPLSYSRKFEGLFSSIGYHPTISLKEKDNKAILEEIDYWLAHLDLLKENVKVALDNIQEKTSLYENKLVEILEMYVK